RVFISLNSPLVLGFSCSVFSISLNQDSNLFLESLNSSHLAKAALSCAWIDVKSMFSWSQLFLNVVISSLSLSCFSEAAVLIALPKASCNFRRHQRDLLIFDQDSQLLQPIRYSFVLVFVISPVKQYSLQLFSLLLEVFEQPVKRFSQRSYVISDNFLAFRASVWNNHLGRVFEILQKHFPLRLLVEQMIQRSRQHFNCKLIAERSLQLRHFLLSSSHPRLHLVVSFLSGPDIHESSHELLLVELQIGDVLLHRLLGSGRKNGYPLVHVLFQFSELDVALRSFPLTSCMDVQEDGSSFTCFSMESNQANACCSMSW
ncbi:unnamed protein product, partial [Callosobruchus maculatus]